MSDTRPQPPIEPPEMPDAEGTRVQGDISKTKGMQPTIPSPATPSTAPKNTDTQEVAETRAAPPAPSRGARSPMHTPPAGTRVPEKAKVPPPPPAPTGTWPEKPKRGQPPPPQRLAPPPLAAQTGREVGSRGLYLPVWSVMLTLMLVCGATSCIVLAVLGLGGRAAPAAAPQFVVITAVVPTNTAFVPDLLAPSPVPNQLIQTGTVPAFSLVGPTLPPVIISPTPETISVGKTVIVNSEESGLNVREGAGIQNTLLFISDDGEQFTVVDGPLQADGLTWWKIQSPNDPTRTGWAAAVYLELPLPTT